MEWERQHQTDDPQRVETREAETDTDPRADSEPERGTVDAGDETSTEDRLFPDNDREEAERRWLDIQAKFVDEPRSSVEEANALVADLVDRLVSGFGEERSRLEAQWARGDDVTTEDLRVTLQRYRSFFGRLLDV
jgi:hypothetical protein